MSESAISVESLVKKFRRFQRPGWRALDALGVRVPSSKYDEFVALNNVSLEIRRGEKVALIGRNGAGKSTLLRAVCGQVQPDAGKIIIGGKIQALMELGTGFHPDFSGIENIHSALAYQGVPQDQANQIIDDIIEFSELEDFIRRPVREYSAGMYTRLAFAVATAVTPDILIIDEILGAGDAYFVGKSIQRMRALTSQGTTVLFVSHDMSAVQLLCERGIWIEHGAVKADGDVLSVSKSYLASVRADEELRTRARSMALSKNIVGNVANARASIYRLISENGTAPLKSASVSAIRFGCDNEQFGAILASDTDGASRLIVEHGVTNWSNVQTADGQPYRNFGDFGGKFVHAPFQIDWTGAKDAGRWIELEYTPSDSDALLLESFDEAKQQYVLLATIPCGSSQNTWRVLRVPIEDRRAPETTSDTLTLDLQELTPEDRYGQGPVKITAFGFFDSADERRHTLVSGDEATAIMAFDAQDHVTDPVAVVAIYRPDGTCAMQVTSNRGEHNLGCLIGSGQIRVRFSPLFLGPGDYVASVALFKDLNLASRHEPEAYDLHDRCYALKVLPPPGIGVEIGLVNQPAAWELLT